MSTISASPNIAAPPFATISPRKGWRRTPSRPGLRRNPTDWLQRHRRGPATESPRGTGDLRRDHWRTDWDSDSGSPLGLQGSGGPAPWRLSFEGARSHKCKAPRFRYTVRACSETEGADDTAFPGYASCAGPRESSMSSQENAVVAIYGAHAGAEEAIEDPEVWIRSKATVDRRQGLPHRRALGGLLQYWRSMQIGTRWTPSGAASGGCCSVPPFLPFQGLARSSSAGPLVTWMIAALESALVVGGFGSIGAALFGMGIPKDSILQYETALRSDRFLLLAHGTAEEVAKARDILQTTKPEAVGCCIGMTPTTSERSDSRPFDEAGLRGPGRESSRLRRRHERIDPAFAPTRSPRQDPHRRGSSHHRGRPCGDPDRFGVFRSRTGSGLRRGSADAEDGRVRTSCSWNRSITA